MSKGPFLRKYGVQTTFLFDLFEVDGINFRSSGVTFAAADSNIMKDEGAEANTTNVPTDEGQGYSIVLTATEMQAARIKVYFVDSATKLWLDTSITIETYGNASAQHAVDLNDSVRAGLTALPNAAADAAGGLVISDAGALDIDAKLANTNEITVARMGALTDWLNGGRLDLLLDAIPTTAMRGTDGANTTTPLTAAQVNAEVDTALADIHLDHLMAAAAADVVVDGSVIAHIVSATEDWSTFVPSDDSLQAIRDRGDSSWVTGASGTGLTPLDSGTLRAGGTTTQALLPTARTFADDILNGTVINLLTGTGAGQTRNIIDYDNATDTATVSPAWITDPDATTTYEVVQGSANVEAWNGVDLVTTNPLPNAAPDTSGGLATEDGNGNINTNVRRWNGTGVGNGGGFPNINVRSWNSVDLVTTNPLPNAAADAAGGLPISDAGGLDIDAKLANTNEITVARMGAITDWINGGRLDLLLDAIPTTAMRGTDGALTDKAGFSLSTAGILAIWHQLTSAIVTASTIGKLIVDNLNATVSSRMAEASIATTGGAVDNVTLVDTTTTNSDMRGTDGAATPAQVNAEVVDALATDTHAEITGVPGFPVSITTMIRRMYNTNILGIDISATKKKFLDSGGAAEWEKDLADDDTNYTETSGNAP